MNGMLSQCQYNSLVLTPEDAPTLAQVDAVKVRLMAVDDYEAAYLALADDWRTLRNDDPRLEQVVRWDIYHGHRYRAPGDIGPNEIYLEVWETVLARWWECYTRLTGITPQRRWTDQRT